MLKKLTNKKGFTLMEMLIVVAIIAVLVAIAIPTFNGALTKSKEAADVANVRATYAEWQTAMLTENTKAPADKDAFLKGPAGNDTLTLNYPDKLTVANAVRITWGGVYVHSAPWSVGSQGYANVSHGCINLSPDNAAWYFDTVHVGDPIIVRQ